MDAIEPSGWIKRLIKRACQQTFSSSGRVKRPCVIALQIQLRIRYLQVQYYDRQIQR